MTGRLTSLDLKQARRDPAKVFGEPDDIVACQDLSRVAKLHLLRQWERDARGLAVATDEGMAGSEESMLSRVRRAIRLLGDTDGDPPRQTTRHGG